MLSWVGESRVRLAAFSLVWAITSFVLGYGISGLRTAEDWTATFTGLTGLILAITAFFVLRGVDDAKRTRHGVLVTELSKRWDDHHTQNSMKRFGQIGADGIIALYDRVYGDSGVDVKPEDVDDIFVLGTWPELIETVGVLHDERALSTQVVYKMWGPQINVAWEVWQRPVKHVRKLIGSPTTFKYFEELAEAMLVEATAALNEAGADQTEFRPVAAAAAAPNGS